MRAFTHTPARRRNPQSAALAVTVAGVLSSTREDPGLRLAGMSKVGRIFTGTATVQRFVRPASPNAPETLDAFPVKTNQRRALNRMRGLGMVP